MDWLMVRNKAEQFLEKYKYAILVLGIGLGLMLIPGNSIEETAQPVTEDGSSQETMEDRLTALLSQIHGAGRVQVLLTTANGEEILYQTDEDLSSGDTDIQQRTDTVIITGQNRDQEGLVRQINPPKYLGAVIVCQGADSASVRLAIVDAVSKATGLGANSISVLKMK